MYMQRPKKIVLIFLLTFLFSIFFVSVKASMKSTADRLKGMILLQVESKGEAWYVEPVSGKRIYLGRPANAFQIMRQTGLGISNADLSKIPGVNEPEKNVAFVKKLAGRILLQTQSKGEAWHVDTITLRKHFLGRPGDAFLLMRSIGLGVKNSILDQIPIKTLPSAESPPANPPVSTPKPQPPVQLSPQLQAILNAANPTITIVGTPPQTAKVNEFFNVSWRIDIGQTLFAHNIGVVWGPVSVPDPKSNTAYPNGMAPLCVRGCNATAPSSTTSMPVLITAPGKYYYRAHASFYGIDKWSEERIINITP
jgi:hypothetical protein